MNQTTVGVLSVSEVSRLIESLQLPSQQASVVKSLLDGMSDKEIAVQMGISIPTVRTHMSRLFRKYDVKDRCALILHLFRHFRTSCERPLNPQPDHNTGV